VVLSKLSGSLWQKKIRKDAKALRLALNKFHAKAQRNKGAKEIFRRRRNE
jgi:hypothetical protein